MIDWEQSWFHFSWAGSKFSFLVSFANAVEVVEEYNRYMKFMFPEYDWAVGVSYEYQYM